MSARMTALIIDDDNGILQAYRRVLTAAGFQVSMAEDGLDALMAVQEGNYDVVVVDLMMPQFDGVETINIVRASNANVAIVVTTGSTSSEDIERAWRAGADRVLLKPVENADLVKAVQEAVGKSKAIASR